jgi:ribosome biogenesis protein Nip4
MIKEINDFASLFGSSLNLDEELTVRKQNRVFLINDVLKEIAPKDFFYAGTYLGRIVKGKLFPGFELLTMIARKKANEIIVDKKTEWLFICGRDIFKQGIVKTIGSGRKDEHVLVLNDNGECLGYGRILCDLEKTKSGLAVKNMLDIGDFLRREKQT